MGGYFWGIYKKMNNKKAKKQSLSPMCIVPIIAPFKSISTPFKYTTFPPVPYLCHCNLAIHQNTVLTSGMQVQTFKAIAAAIP